MLNQAKILVFWLKMGKLVATGCTKTKSYLSWILFYFFFNCEVSKDLLPGPVLGSFPLLGIKEYTQMNACSLQQQTATLW